MLIPQIPPLDERCLREAERLQASLTKPAGSLGQLEKLAVRIAGMTGQLRPSLRNKLVLVAAGDHGVAQEGVSAFPPEVTRQMVLNFLSGGAAVNVLARQVGARLVVVNAGVGDRKSGAQRFENSSGETLLVDRPVAGGTENMLLQPAMTQEELELAFELGRETLSNVEDPSPDLIAVGEMGIANSTSAAAIVSAMTGKSPSEVTGRGTGVGDETLLRKTQVVADALERHGLDREDPLRVLRCVGGLEIAALVGVLLEAASRRKPIVLDGFICGSAALVAAALKPEATGYFLAGHRSAEAGHRAVLEALDLEPVLELDLRLGEASGAVLALPIVEASVRTMNEMATFSGAQVSGRNAAEGEPR